MLFNSIEFVFFFILVTSLYFVLPHRFRWFMLLAASCYFYMAFVPVYILILGFTIVIDYFAGIYGALEDYKNYSKKMVIERIIRTHQLHGSNFVAFGDGYVEIEDSKSVDGIAVGVASDEKNRSGVDAWKRNRLIAAGADIIIPDFREAGRLEEFLFSAPVV